MRETSTAHSDQVWTMIFAAWAVALFATIGALFIGEVMGQAPCDLCWYQRAAMFPLVLVLGIATLRPEGEGWRYALPVAAVGLAIALFHTLLYFKILPTAIKPCGQGPSCSGDGMTVFGELPIPLLSVLAFSVIAVLLILVRQRTKP